MSKKETGKNLPGDKGSSAAGRKARYQPPRLVRIDLPGGLVAQPPGPQPFGGESSSNVSGAIVV